MKSIPLLPTIALLISILGIGAAPLFVVISEVDPTATLMLRMLITSILFLMMPTPWRLQQAESNHKKSISKLKIFLLLFFVSLIFCADLTANHWAVKLTSIANASILMNTSPIFTLLIGALFFKDKITYFKFLAVIIAIIGGLLMISDNVNIKTDLLGECLALLAAFLYACYLIIIQALRHYLSTKVIMFFNCLITSLILLPIVLFYNPYPYPTTIKGIVIIISLAVCAQLLGHGLLTYALKYIDATTSALSALARPIVSIFFAYFLLGQHISLFQSIGICLVLFSMILFNYQKFHRTTSEKVPTPLKLCD